MGAAAVSTQLGVEIHLSQLVGSSEQAHKLAYRHCEARTISEVSAVLGVKNAQGRFSTDRFAQSPEHLHRFPPQHLAYARWLVTFTTSLP